MNRDTKSKIKLTALLLVAILPISLATYSFKSIINSGVMGGTSNQGVLISPPIDITYLDMKNSEGQAIFKTFEEEVKGISADDFEPRPWLLVYANSRACEQDCRERLHYLRQLHIALGKNTPRARRYYIDLTVSSFDQKSTSLNAETLDFFKLEFPSMGIAYSDLDVVQKKLDAENLDIDLTKEPYVFLIDPVGNVMMYYTEEHSPQQIMSDLEKLLKYSSLG